MRAAMAFPIDPARPPSIEWVPVGLLRPNPKNARTHSRKQIKWIAASIRQHSFLNPILVDEGNMILAGRRVRFPCGAGRLELAG